MTNSTDALSLIHETQVFVKEFIFLMTFIYHVWLCILIFGLVSNTINVLVFGKIGFRDNVTVTLLFLSLSDLLNLILRCPMTVSRFDHDWPFDPDILYLCFYWYAYVFYDYSSFISVFLALVRCFCVARPLLFKSMFTTSRTVKILIVLFLVALALRAPVLTVFRLTWAVNPLTNSSYMSVRPTDNFREMYKVNDILNRNIVAWIAYITMVTCVIILASKLQAASRFRQSTQSTTHVPATDDGNSNIRIDKTKNGTNSLGKKEKQHNSLSTKDLQVIKSVTLICVIFILSQLLFQITSTIRLFDPEFSTSRKRSYLFSFVLHITETCGYLNTSLNIFVHYGFNIRYRETFFSFFSKRPVKVSGLNA